MLKKTWVKRVLYAVIAVATLEAAGVLCVVMADFTYYDNGEWVKTNMWTIYKRSREGYGKDPVEERRLEPDWGSDAGYAARNFTLDLAGLDYSTPLSWMDDNIIRQSLWVMKPPNPLEWKEVALYPTGITVLPGEKLELRVEIVGEDGFIITEQGPVFTKSYPITLYRPRLSSVAYVVAVGEAEPGGLAASITDVDGAINTVRKGLEAERDEDFEAWVSTLFLKEQRDFHIEQHKQSNFVFGVISLTIEDIRLAVRQTCDIRAIASGSDRSKSYGWTDEYIAENTVVVFAKYPVDYDNRKVPYREGTLTRYCRLQRDDKSSPWLFFDLGGPG